MVASLCTIYKIALRVKKLYIVYDSQALISIDPVRARDDPVIVKNIPYHKAKKALEAEVMKIDPPPRPANWGVRILFLHSIQLALICQHLSLFQS